MGALPASPLLDGRYLVLEMMGRGGMGRVYRAFDRAEERMVAIKVVDAPGRRGASHPLAGEFAAWSCLSHPNIVEAYGLGSARRGPLPAGTPYLVLENFPGWPANRALPPRPDGRVEELAGGVLQALAHVHAAGLVHRDLKPGNVLVNGTRRRPRVKLTDFGLAVPAGTSEEPGTISGSLPYVSPEAILGGPVDGRSDLYGLGILLFVLATGRLPAPGHDARSVLRWHLQGPPADPGKIRPQISFRLARLVRRLTERDPARRPAGASEALHLLGLPPPRTRKRHAVKGRADRAALRLAVDAARLGGRRRVHLPKPAGAASAALREIGVLAQIHGISVVRLGRRDPDSVADPARVVLRLLLERGGEARGMIRRYRLERRFPLGLLGGVPVWDRMRRASSAVPEDAASLRATARGVAALLLDCSTRRGTAVVLKPGYETDLLTREIARLLGEAVDRDGGPDSRRGGLLLVEPAS